MRYCGDHRFDSSREQRRRRRSDTVSSDVDRAGASLCGGFSSTKITVHTVRGFNYTEQPGSYFPCDPVTSKT